MSRRIFPTPAQLRAAWAALPPETEVGYRCLPASCPLAEALYDRHGDRYEVDGMAYIVDGKSRRLPPWAARFTDLVDKGTGWVTAAEALRLLAEATER